FFLHTLQPARWLDRNSSGIESDALADQSEHGRWRSDGRLIAKHDHARRFAAASGDPEQESHPKLCNLVLVEHLDLHARFSSNRGSLHGELSRRERIARLVP